MAQLVRALVTSPDRQVELDLLWGINGRRKQVVHEPPCTHCGMHECTHSLYIHTQIYTNYYILIFITYKCINMYVATYKSCIINI